MLVEDKTSTAAIRPVGMECVDENRFTVSTDMLFSTNMLSLTGQGCGMCIVFSTNMLSLTGQGCGMLIAFSTDMLSCMGLIIYFRLLKTIISCLFRRRTVET